MLITENKNKDEKYYLLLADKARSYNTGTDSILEEIEILKNNLNDYNS